ncbi:MAG: hypothetical protein K2X86_18335 [Cytophagaceae bacterium]|nr:hypothetical protein [Cytophagaceae bacterium]
MGKSLLAKLNKIYQPDARIDMRFRGNDLTFLTNELGEPVQLFIGKRNKEGNISGDRYSRRIKKRVQGKITESHWDNKGKTD